MWLLLIVAEPPLTSMPITLPWIEVSLPVIVTLASAPPSSSTKMPVAAPEMSLSF